MIITFVFIRGTQNLDLKIFFEKETPFIVIVFFSPYSKMWVPLIYMKAEKRTRTSITYVIRI